MLPDTIPTKSAAAGQPIVRRRALGSEETDSLFEHVAWLYAFCRENVFRDDTERIISLLWPDHQPRPGTKLMELGCGPGFYSRKLARRFPQLSVTGIDRSERQILWARARARSEAIQNCVFERVNALEIPWDDRRFDVLITSRLFTVLRDPERAIGEMFRVLRPGGRCFIAEPRYAFSASIPLMTMWLLARCSHSGNGYREPRKATVYSGNELRSLIGVQPWTTLETWCNGRYHYALCQKG
jgi:ubiquinone/menaquinone biosynthesis C-methylase UbiE